MFEARFKIWSRKISRVATHRRGLRRSVRSRLFAIRNPQSEFRIGLTLIELLVVIVIMVTLVAGVIPILSPNNDTRKIREATRMLKTYITQAQAEAARTGRAQGIAFRETSAGSGVALDVFRLEVPPPFAGFSSASRVRTELAPAPFTYNPNAKNTFKFHPRYTSFTLYKLTFELANSTVASPVYDPLPPRMFRVGDVIDISGNQFLVVDGGRNIEQTYGSSTPSSAVKFLDPSTHSVPFFNSLECVWINYTGQIQPQGLKRYKILRQPSNSIESPIQFPAGICIDMQGSVAEGSTRGSPAGESLFQTGVQNTVGIMFSPAGNVSNVYFNGSPLTNISRIALLLGRVENGGLDVTATPAAWVLKPGEDVETWQSRVNWVNLDSRWLMIAANSGRTIVSANAFVSPTKIAANGGDPTLASVQIEAAHDLAHQMRTVGAGR